MFDNERGGYIISKEDFERDMRGTENGDYMEKPTQYWFIGFEPKQNLVFEAIDYVPKRVCDYIQGKDRARIRSEIHPQYASRFIRQYLIDEKGEK